MSKLAVTKIPNPFTLDPGAHDHTYDFRALTHYFYSTPINTETFQHGIDKLAAVLPWVTWQVKGFPSSDPTEHPYLVPGDHEYFRVEDWTKDATHPTYAELRARGFPMSHIPITDYCKISPGPGHPMGGYEPGDVRPTWFIQLNQLRGGTIVSCSVHHSLHDITGIGNVISLLSRLSEDKEIPAEELNLANQPRLNLVDLSDVTLPPNLEFTFFPPMVGKYNHKNTNNVKWYAFTATKEATVALKAKATETKPASTPFISTDDSLVAFYWQRTLHVRNYDASEFNHPITCSRPVNIRKYLGLRSDYPGMALSCTCTGKTIADALNAPLGELAASLRADLDISEPGNFLDMARMMMKYLQQPDTPRLGNLLPFEPEYDVFNSSWRTQKIETYTFGTGKGADVMRPGQVTPWRGGFLLLPEEADGSTTIEASLTPGDLGLLLGDEEFMKVFKFVG